MCVEPVDQLVWYIGGEGAIGDDQLLDSLNDCSFQILLGIWKLRDSIEIGTIGFLRKTIMGCFIYYFVPVLHLLIDARPGGGA
jgi:hypothetical protein